MLGLTLAEAIKTNRLEDFIAQEEARGVPVANAKEFQKSIDAIIKATPQEDQTSHSRERDGSNGK